MDSCLFESELEIDKLKSDLNAEEKAIETLKARISASEEEILRVEEKRSLILEETRNYENEHLKLQSINEQLRKNAESCKKLRDELKKRLLALNKQWDNEKNERGKILDKYRTSMREKLSEGSSHLKENISEFNNFKEQLLNLLRSKLNLCEEKFKLLEFELRSDTKLPFSDAISFTNYIIKIKSRRKDLKGISSEKSSKQTPTAAIKDFKEKIEHNSSSSDASSLNISSGNNDNFIRDAENAPRENITEEFVNEQNHINDNNDDTEFKRPQKSIFETSHDNQKWSDSFNLFDNFGDGQEEEDANSNCKFEVETSSATATTAAAGGVMSNDEKNITDMSFDNFNFSFDDNNNNTLSQETINDNNGEQSESLMLF